VHFRFPPCFAAHWRRSEGVLGCDRDLPSPKVPASLLSLPLDEEKKTTRLAMRTTGRTQTTTDSNEQRPPLLSFPLCRFPLLRLQHPQPTFDLTLVDIRSLEPPPTLPLALDEIKRRPRVQDPAVVEDDAFARLELVLPAPFFGRGVSGTGRGGAVAESGEFGEGAVEVVEARSVGCRVGGSGGAFDVLKRERTLEWRGVVDRSEGFRRSRFKFESRAEEARVVRSLAVGEKDGFGREGFKGRGGVRVEVRCESVGVYEVGEAAGDVLVEKGVEELIARGVVEVTVGERKGSA
jgi:hypothetical protein